MSPFKFLLTCIVCLTLFSCSSGSSAKDNNPRAKQRSVGVCENESDLMATGIVNGDVVRKGDPDEKTVVMLLGEKTICTAAPITEDILITAAHCVGDDPAKLVAVFYPSLACESGFDITKYSVKVSRIAKHSGYDMTVPVEKRSDDIAIVFLNTNIPKGYPIYQIAEPKKINDSHTMFLYGYGITGEKKGGRGILRKTTVASTNYRINEEDRKVQVDQHNSSGFCMGDSGGPGMVIVDSQMQILGINSYVNGISGDICNNLGYQTLVHPYKEWIEFQKSGYK